MRLIRSLLLLVGVLSTTVLYAQTASVRHSTHVEDQLIQGPCYVFAAIAALESSALENDCDLQPDEVNFNEWQFYSSCALGPFDNGRDAMTGGTLQHAADYGATPSSSLEHWAPTVGDCPNPGNPQLPCLAYFQNCSVEGTWCRNNSQYTQSTEVVGNQIAICDDSDGQTFRFIGGSPHSYRLQVPFGQQVFTSVQNPTAQDFQDALESGKGAIAIIGNYGNVGEVLEHAIFVFEKTGNNYRFKDSWPSTSSASISAGIKSGNIFSLGSVDYMFTVNGNMLRNNASPNPCTEPDPDPEPDPNACDYEIHGTQWLGDANTYTLVNGTGALSNIQWTAPGGTSIVSGQGTASLRLKTNNCTSNVLNRTLSVTYDNGGETCTQTFPITVLGINPPVLQINSHSNVSDICAGSLFELEAVGNYPRNSTFNWSITGGTIVGQSGRTVQVVADNTPGGYQQYRVRVRLPGCGTYSNWRTRTGYLSSSCGGGYIPPQLFPRAQFTSEALDLKDYFDVQPQTSRVQVEAITLEGRSLMVEVLTPGEPLLSLESLPPGFIFLRLTNETTGEWKTFRHLVK